MVPIFINKDVFELSYNDLKFMVWNSDFFCTNLIYLPEPLSPSEMAHTLWSVFLPRLLSPFEMDHVWSMEGISLLSLYHNLLLNSFLHDAKDPQVGGLSSELTWDLGCDYPFMPPYSCNTFTKERKQIVFSPFQFSIDYKYVAYLFPIWHRGKWYAGDAEDSS